MNGGPGASSVAYGFWTEVIALLLLVNIVDSVTIVFNFDTTIACIKPLTSFGCFNSMQ